MAGSRFDPKPAEVVHCAARPCTSVGQAVRALDFREGQTRVPPPGWGEVDVHMHDGRIVTLFVCSRVCERRLARGLATPALGELG